MSTLTPSVEQQIVDLAASVFNAHSVVLFLPATEGDSSGTASLAAYFSLGESLLSDAHIQPGQGLVGWILRNRQPLTVPDFDQQHSNLDYYQGGDEAEIKAFMGCPLPTGGALCVDSKAQRKFSERDTQLLQLFAQLIDSAARTKVVDSTAGAIPGYFTMLSIIMDLRSRHRLWADFIHTYLGCLAEGTGFSYCAFASVNVPGESYCIEAENQTILVRDTEPFFQTMSAGLAGWVFRNGQPVVQTGEDGRAPGLFGSSDDLPVFSAVICIPVQVNRSTRGVLCLGHTTPKPVDEAMRSFLRQAVAQLSLHLENLYLRNRMREMLSRAQVYRSGPHVHDPDTDPYQPPHTDVEG